MKKVTDLSTLSTEELEKRLKLTKTATIMFAVILLFQFAIGLYLSVKNGFSIFIILPAVFVPLLVVNMNNMREIKAEIAKRNAH